MQLPTCGIRRNFDAARVEVEVSFKQDCFQPCRSEPAAATTNLLLRAVVRSHELEIHSAGLALQNSKIMPTAEPVHTASMPQFVRHDAATAGLVTAVSIT